MGTAAPALEIAKDDRKALEALCRSGTVESRLARRATLVLLAADGLSNDEIARRRGTSAWQVRRWRGRFASGGIEGLHDAPRSGRPKSITPVEAASVVATACEEPKRHGERRLVWTHEAIAKAAMRSKRVRRISRSSVQRILETADLKPHKVRSWCHSTDPRFDEKLRDIVTLYTELPGNEPVLCIDEKTGMQARSHHYKLKRASPGRSGRADFEYKRNGTTGFFGCFNVRTGSLHGRCSRRRTRVDFLAFLDEVAAVYRQSRVHIVLDNLSTHTGPRIAEWNRRHGNRFVFHYTPTKGSWLNQVELWFGILQRRVLRFGDFASVEALEAEVDRFVETWNSDEAHPFRWTYTGKPLKV